VATNRFNMRLLPAEAEKLAEGAARFRTTESGFVRRAIAAALADRQLLSPAELDELEQLREQVRRVGVNLNTVLRNLHLYENGATDRLPPMDELYSITAGVRQALLDIATFIERYP
jgi:hypothetical protein